MPSGSTCTRWRLERPCAVILLLWLQAASAIGAPWTMEEYHRSSWTQRDGAPPDIWALAQDRNGSLWLGTGIGLYRFDGISFEHQNPPQGQGFASSNITALLSDTRGRLWIGFYPGGISVLEDGRLRHYPPSPQLPSALVMRMAEDGAGRIWVASFTGLYLFDGKSWRRIGAETGYPVDSADDVLVDSRGTLWVAGGNRLFKLPAGAARFAATGVVTGPYAALLETRSGALWVSDGTNGTRSLSLEGRDPARPPGFGHFASMRLDRSGALWATDRRHGGVVRVSALEERGSGHVLAEEEVAAIIRKRDGLASDRTIPVLVDREGNVWVGTNMGLHRFRPSSVRTLQHEDLSQNDVYGMAYSPSHGLLVSSERRLFRVHDGRLELLVESAGRRICAIHAVGAKTYVVTWDQVYEYSAGGLHTLDLPGTGTLSAVAGDASSGLLVMRQGDGLFHFDGRAWTWLGQNLIPAHGATSLLRDTDGSLWIGYNGSRIVHWNKGAVRHFGPEAGLDIGTVSALARTGDGVLAGGESGAALLAANGVVPLRAADRNRLNGISGIRIAPNGDAWINGISGVLHVPSATLGRLLQDGRLDGRLYDTADGMPGIAQQSALMSTIVPDGSGRLWFATNQGLAVIEPDKPYYNPVAPTVRLQALVAGSTEYPPTPGRLLAPGTRDIQIRYAASSLAYPERMRFRYRLEGFDDAWREAGNRRVAYYTNLGPGAYRFSVQAANESGVWSAPNSALAFSVAPRFTETWWFIALCGLALGALVWVAYLVRLRHVSQRLHMRFEERHRERERIARELHDTLLQSFQGLLLRFQAVASRLPGDDPTREALERAMDRGEEAIAEGRERVRSLRLAETSVQEGLPEAFTRIGRELAQAHPATFDLVVEGRLPPLDAVVRDEIYWIGREALSNAFRHADASRIEVGISSAGGSMVFRFRDDGCGIGEDIRRQGARVGHWGLAGMRERAAEIGAELHVWSEPGNGTEVELTVPAARARGWMRRRRRASASGEAHS